MRVSLLDYKIKARTHLYSPSLLPESSTYSLQRAPPHRVSTTVLRQLRSRKAFDEENDQGQAYALETPTERLRRLRFEMEELEVQVEQQKEQRKGQDSQQIEGEHHSEEEVLPRRDDADKSRPVQRRKRKPSQLDPNGELSAAVLLSQLTRMRGRLGHLDVMDANREEEEETKALPIVNVQARTSELLKKLEDLENGALESDVADEMHAVSASLQNLNHVSEATSSRTDERLRTLERYVGSNEAEFDEVSNSSFFRRDLAKRSQNQSSNVPQPLLATLTKLEHQLHLLTQPRHLDTISRRVRVLVTDLERVHEARRKIGDTRPLNIALASGISISTGPSTSISGDQLPPDALQKIDGLFALLPRIDPLIPLIPNLLTRLRSLSTLHSSSTTFSKDIQSVEHSVETLNQSETFLRSLLEQLQESLTSNQEVVKSNLESLQRRVDDVVRRVENLT